MGVIIVILLIVSVSIMLYRWMGGPIEDWECPTCGHYSSGMGEGSPHDLTACEVIKLRQAITDLRNEIKGDHG